MFRRNNLCEIVTDNIFSKIKNYNLWNKFWKKQCIKTYINILDMKNKIVNKPIF